MRALTLSTGRLTVELLPDWGSKMVSLRTERDGYEFLAAAGFGPHAPDPSVYAPEDAYGFDEMFPGPAPEPFLAGPWGEGLRVGDHGDLWYRAWEYAAENSKARLWVSDERLGWRFGKRLWFSDPLTLITDYRIENRGRHAWPWMYTGHILCRYHAGIELILPAGQYRQFETFGQPLPEVCTAETPALRRFDTFPDRSAAFYVSDEVGPQSCTLHDARAGKALQVSWSNPVCYLAMWYNRGGWLDDKPLTHVGLEPSTAGLQGLADWTAAGRAPWLEPGAEAHWRLTFRIEDKD